MPDLTISAGAHPLETAVEYFPVEGNLVPADPFQPLWNIPSALMPGTRPDNLSIFQLSWVPTVQHITAYYPNKNGTFLRRHWLVICRYCKRVAEYTWNETLTPLYKGGLIEAGDSTIEINAGNNSGIFADHSGAVIGGVVYTTEQLAEANNVAPEAVSYLPNLEKYTLGDGTGEYVIPTETDTWYRRKGEYITHASDGSWVRIRESDSNTPGFTNSDVTISPSLNELSTANPWGWIDVEGPNDMHPGPPGGPLWYATQTNVTTSEWSGQCYQHFTGSNGSQNDIDFMNITPRVRIDFARWPNPVSHSITLTGETYLGLSWGSGGVYSVGAQYGVAGGGRPHSGLPLYSPVYVGPAPVVDPAAIQAAIDGYMGPLNDAINATQEAHLTGSVHSAKFIVNSIVEMMEAKKFGPDPEVAELRPYDQVFQSHTEIQQALLIPAYASAQLTFTRDSTHTDTYEWNSTIKPTLFGPWSAGYGPIYGTTLSLGPYGANGTPVVPPPPDTPWAISIGSLKVFKYSSATKTFSAKNNQNVTWPALPLVNAYFSKTLVPPLLLGQSKNSDFSSGLLSLGTTGFYKTRTNVAAFANLSGASLSALMKKLCVGTININELAYIVYSALATDKVARNAKYYRAADHTHSLTAASNVPDVYSFLQPKTLPIVPDIPEVTSYSRSPSGNSVTVSFNPPNDGDDPYVVTDGGSPITQYTVTVLPGPISLTENSYTITVGGLQNGASYLFSVVATNAIGTGEASAPQVV